MNKFSTYHIIFPAVQLFNRASLHKGKTDQGKATQPQPATDTPPEANPVCLRNKRTISSIPMRSRAIQQMAAHMGSVVINSQVQ